MTEDVSYLQACVGCLCLILFYIFFREMIDIGLHAMYCRRAQYDCDLCRYWSCPAHYCKRKRKLREKKNPCVGCEYRPCTFEEYKKFCPKRNTNDSAGAADQDGSCSEDVLQTKRK